MYFSKVSRRVLLSVVLALGIAALPLMPAHAAGPCCAIVSIDQAKGIVTLRDTKTGEISKVKVADPAQLAKLKAGQPAERSIGMTVPLK
jgi:hypothetical protein